MKKLLLLIVFLDFVSLTGPGAGAQERRICVIHPWVGQIIDRAERDSLHLFPDLVGFVCAGFYLNHDSTFTLQIMIEDSNQTRDLISRQMTRLEVAAIADHIASYVTYPSNPLFPDCESAKPNKPLQLLLGTIGGAVGALGLSAAMMATTDYPVVFGTPSGGQQAALIIAAMAGGALGSAGGVALASSNCYPEGSFLAAAFGGFFGTAFFVVGGGVGATLGYNASRGRAIRELQRQANNHENHPAKYSFLKLRIGPNPFHQSELMPKLELVETRF